MGNDLAMDGTMNRTLSCYAMVMWGCQREVEKRVGLKCRDAQRSFLYLPTLWRRDRLETLADFTCLLRYLHRHFIIYSFDEKSCGLFAVDKQWCIWSGLFGTPS